MTTTYMMANMPSSTLSWSLHRALQIVASLCVLVVLISWSKLAQKPVHQQPESAMIKSAVSSSSSSINNPSDVVDFNIRTLPNPRHDNQTCLSQGLPEYPEEGSLLRRMPFAIIIGAMKSGTSALDIYLCQHPQVMKPKRKELHFFDFEYETFASHDNGIDRKRTRMHYQLAFERVLGTQGMQQLMARAVLPTTPSFPPLVALDDSPRYLFLSDRVPARILCVAPWAKVLAILRNPVDRAFSQYNMKLASKGAKRLQQGAAATLPTFEEWIEMDFQLLTNTGVLSHGMSQTDFAGSTAEMKAWKNYTRNCRHAPIGRGLYALQLRHWFQAYEAAGKSRSDFFIIQSEYFKKNKNQVYNDVLRFLGLEPFDLQHDKEPNSGFYREEMNATTRARLEAFYAPYNQELYALLGKEWEGVWDP